MQRDPYDTMALECGVRVADAWDQGDQEDSIRYNVALAEHPQLRDDPGRFGSLGPQ